MELASLDHALGPSIRHWRRVGSGISGGSESSDYFLANGFASVSGGHGRSWWVFAKIQAIGKMAWMPGTAPGVNGIEIALRGFSREPVRFISRSGGTG